MPFLIQRRPWPSQPQGAVELSSAYKKAEIVSLLNEITGRDTAKGNNLVPQVGYEPTITTTPFGRALNFNGSQFCLSNSTVNPVGLPFTVFAWVTPKALNSSYKRILETDYSVGFYLGSNTGTQYAFIVNNSTLEGCIGGQQVVGQRDFLCGVFDGTNRLLYVNGVRVGSAVATAPNYPLKLAVGGASGGTDLWTGNIDTVGVFHRAFPAAEVWSIYKNPYQILKAPARRLWVVTVSGITLTGAASTQANNASTAAITQTHIIVGANSAQANASSAAAITQVQVLVGANSTQGNVASAGSITQGHALTGAASTQANTSATGAISQAHVIAGAASVQANTASAAAITQTHILTGANSSQANTASAGAITQGSTLVGAACTQANTSSTGAVSQTHVLVGANSAQANIGGTGAISLGAVNNLAGAASTQGNAVSTGAITQAHVLVMAPSVQDNIAAASAIVQAHILAAAASTQANLSGSGAITLGNEVISLTVARTAAFRASASRSAVFQRSKSVIVRFN